MISTFLNLHFYFYISYDYFLLDFIFIYVFSFLEHSELIPNISSKINCNDIILFSCVHALSSPNLHFFQRFFFCNFKLNFFNTSRRSHDFFLNLLTLHPLDHQELSDLSCFADGTTWESKANVDNFSV